MMARSTRAQALRAAAAAGAAMSAAALIGGSVRPERSAGKPSAEQDVRILNFLLVLEEAQAAFYDAALRGRALSGDLLEFVRVVAPQEREHVDFLRRRLGAQADAKPRFDFGGVTSDGDRFRDTAIELEETTAAAYIGQGANLTRDSVLDAARIVAVEARHAAWIRDLAGELPAPRAADPPRAANDVLSDLRGKGFLR
jgi:Ferritin-like domain